MCWCSQTTVTFWPRPVRATSTSGSMWRVAKQRLLVNWSTTWQVTTNQSHPFANLRNSPTWCCPFQLMGRLEFGRLTLFNISTLLNCRSASILSKFSKVPLRLYVVAPMLSKLTSCTWWWKTTWTLIPKWFIFDQVTSHYKTKTRAKLHSLLIFVPTTLHSLIVLILMLQS